jgi:DNA-binding response OmpR family regulator
MVVDANPERCETLCAMLRHHGLAPYSVRLDELAMESQACSGVALIANHSGQTSGWELARRINTFAPHLPVVLLGPGEMAVEEDMPTVQAVLPDDAAGPRIAEELKHWLAVRQPRGGSYELGAILLVDDDPKIRAILQSFLELRGFEVRLAETGEAALQSLAMDAPRAILLDMKMPGMDGLLTLKHIRAQHPSLPVIVITSLDEDPTMEEAELLGANDYLIKPFNLQHLEAVLLTKLFA